MSLQSNFRPVVFVARTISSAGMNRLRETCEVVEWKEAVHISQGTLLDRLKECRPHGVLVHPFQSIDSQVLDAAGPQLKVVSTFSVGLNHIDLEECRRRGVQVGYTPDVLTGAVAEHTVGLLLSTARNYKPGMEAVHKGVWGTRWDNVMWMAGKEVGGSVLGIVGLGRIGFAVAKRLKAFNPSRIIYSGSGPKDGATELGAEFVTFDNLLSQSDFVIATCSINENNKGLFNKEAFTKMKKTAFFINVSRGILVCQEDLYDALVSGQIRGAGLDVTSPEPLPPDHCLLKVDNCIILPHLGTVTWKTITAMSDVTVNNILAGLNRQPLPSSAL